MIAATDDIDPSPSDESSPPDSSVDIDPSPNESVDIDPVDIDPSSDDPVDPSSDDPVDIDPSVESTMSTMTAMSIQVGSPYASPPYFRFVLAPTGPSAQYYKSFWPLGVAGPDGGGNIQLNSGVDIPLPADVIIPGRTAVRVPLGVRARGLTLYWGPPGMAPGGVPSSFLIMARGSLTVPGVRHLILTNSVGLVDANYVGELVASIYNLDDTPTTLKKGEAVVQLVAPGFVPLEYSRADPGSPLMDLFDQTARGEGRFGSTGAAGSSTE
jgi:dUTP pyrophosphatase